MQVKQLFLRNFRNYDEEAVTFSPGINLIYGQNGAGKTNLLEALYLLSTGRSFRTAHLKDLIYQNRSHFYLEAQFEKDSISQSLSIGFDGQTKKIHSNASSLESFSQLLGILPSVLYSPSDSQLVSGAPLERRRFLNIQLSQNDPLYVHHLIRYQKGMKNRNALLKMKSEAGIACYESVMAESARYLMKKRSALVEALNPAVHTHAKYLSGEEDVFELSYHPSISLKQIDDLTEAFAKHRKKDLLLGTTLHGPHRDDFLILTPAGEAKIYASEGQKRTVTAALKLSERELLGDKAALMGIDDFGIHLDQKRSHLLYHAIASLPQVFLTAPSDNLIDETRPSHLIFVDQGTLIGFPQQQKRPLERKETPSGAF